MRGVRFFGDGIRTSSVIMQNDPHQIRFIDSIHVEQTRTGQRITILSTDVAWRRNLFAVTAATFIGFTGFTLVMPFLPLYFQQLGVTDVGRDRDVDRAQPRRHAGAHGAAARRSGAGSATASAARSWSSARWSASSS